MEEEVKGVEENRSKCDGRGDDYERHSNILSHAMCVQENVCDDAEQRRLTKKTTRTFTCSCCAAHVFMLCCVLFLWILVFTLSSQRSARWSSVAFHHAYAMPSAEFFPSGCCSPIVYCHRPLNLYTKFLHISHLENGSFEVLSLHTP